MIATAAVPARLNRYFLLSTYLTIILANVCLVFAEWKLMPEIRFVAAFVGLLLVTAYILEGRWSLSVIRANLLGGTIATVLGVWLTFQSLRPSHGLLRQIPWPTSLLPYLGPLLMLLLPAKMLRPKTPTDFWWAQLIGLACVGLSCVLADDPIFGVLLLAYLVAGLWCLSLFLLYRQCLTRTGTPSLARAADLWPDWQLGPANHRAGNRDIPVHTALRQQLATRWGTARNRHGRRTGG